MNLAPLEQWTAHANLLESVSNDLTTHGFPFPVPPGTPPALAAVLRDARAAFDAAVAAVGRASAAAERAVAELEYDTADLFGVQ